MTFIITSECINCGECLIYCDSDAISDAGQFYSIIPVNAPIAVYVLITVLLMPSNRFKKFFHCKILSTEYDLEK